MKFALLLVSIGVGLSFYVAIYGKICKKERLLLTLGLISTIIGFELLCSLVGSL